MKKERSNHLLRPSLLTSLLIFILSYLFFLFLWLLVKDYYGIAITSIASYLITLIKNVSIHSIEMKGDVIAVGFIPHRYGLSDNILIVIDVKNFYYTFNVPLTLAVMAAFYPYVKRKRAYIEVLLILFLIHFLFVFMLEGQRLTSILSGKGFEEKSTTKLALWTYFQAFVGSMVIRMESFLIGVYLYFSRSR